MFFYAFSKSIKEYIKGAFKILNIGQNILSSRHKNLL